MGTKDAEALLELPLFSGLTAAQLEELLAVFEEVRLATGEILFEAGAEASYLHILMEGRIELRENAKVRFSLNPPAPIGELGVVTSGIRRHTTAVAAEPSAVLRVSREALMERLEQLPEIAFRVQQNLLEVVSDKIRRDERRIAEMRANIIRTQKAMKRLREEILQQPETAISEAVHDVLEALIRRNRRANYSIQPPKALPCRVRTGDGALHDVRAIARTQLSLPASATEDNGQWKGVLVLPQTEIPLSGTTVERTEEEIEVELDLMLEDYSAALEDYLTRAQMLDVLV